MIDVNSKIMYRQCRGKVLQVIPIDTQIFEQNQGIDIHLAGHIASANKIATQVSEYLDAVL